jgi:Fe-S-cluster-containing dehydrogenase component
MKKWYFIIDVEKCENCQNCFLACKDEFVGNTWTGYSAAQPDHGHKWMNVLKVERGQFPLIDVGYLPTPCMHCDDAPCIKAAKNGAIYKRPDGIVIIDPDKAKGQKNVVTACPYNAIWWNDELDIPQKCTLCAHLLDEGWDKSRCVQSCPTGALSMKLVEENAISKIIASEKLEFYLPERKTNPCVLYKNLYRFTKCFIGGTVAVKLNGKEECAEGARVTLLNSAREKIGEFVTDNFGDFKFDNLDQDSGKYTLSVDYQNHDTKTLDVDLKTSINVGVIKL